MYNDFLTFGEILIDFTPDTPSADGMPRYIQNPGGAVLNCAATVAKYGASACLIGCVGNDLFGRYLIDYVKKLGIDPAFVTHDDYNTTLAFVSLADNGERDFAFYRKHNADLMMSPGDMPIDMIKHARIFHFGSLSLCAEPARTCTYKAINTAKEAGVQISYDPNYREPLWRGEDYIGYMRSVLDDVDLIKVSEEEALMLTGYSEPEKAAKELHSHGIKFAAVTLGENGSFYSTDKYSGYAEPFKVNAIDTTGAGDVFFGTFLYEYMSKNISLENESDVRAAVLKANKAAALCTTKKGGAPSIPEYCDICQ